MLEAVRVFIGKNPFAQILRAKPQSLNTQPASVVNFQHCTQQEPAMRSSNVLSDPDILGGTPVFVGTRVPIRILFEHLEAGDSLQVFLEDFPSVSRELAIQVLEDARASLVPDAHPA